MFCCIFVGGKFNFREVFCVVVYVCVLFFGVFIERIVYIFFWILKILFCVYFLFLLMSNGFVGVLLYVLNVFFVYLLCKFYIFVFVYWVWCCMFDWIWLWFEDLYLYDFFIYICMVDVLSNNVFISFVFKGGIGCFCKVCY